MTGNYSVLRNTSHGDQRMTNKYVWFGGFLPISMVIIVGNSIALTVFLRKTFRVKKSNYLLVNLTIADLLVGVSYAFLSVMATAELSKVFSNNIAENSKLAVLESILLLSVNVSIYTLSVISVERVLAVFWPFHHRLVKRWHYFTAIALVWILSFFPLLQHTLSRKRLWHYLSYYVLMFILLLTIFVSYLSIWIKMKFFTKFRNCRTFQENSKLTKTLFIVTVVSVGTWLPRIIFDNVVTIHPDILNARLNGNLYLILSILLLSNSFWNVIVYSVRIPEFQRELKHVFCKFL